VTVESVAAGTQSAIAPAGSAAIEKKGQADQVRRALELLKPQMAAALPRHLTPERLCRVAMTAIQNTPKLLECDRTSLFAAVMTCAQLGLEPDGVLGQAYLVPFKGKVQFIPGYKGLISLARNSGEVLSINAHEVCKNDRFAYAFGLDEKLEHVPASGDRGPITHFYAVAKFKGGGHHFEVLTRAEVEAIRDGSSGYKQAVQYAKVGEDPRSPWVQNFPEMGKKTAIRRMAKYLPMNVQKAAAMADMYDAGRHSELGDFGELRVDAPAADVIDVSPEPDPQSGLDSFASGTTPAATPQVESSPGEPALISPERAKSLRELAAERGLDGDAIAAEISGAGLESTPVGFETTILRAIEAAPKSKAKKG